MLGQCAREAGELEGASHGCWCDVLLVVMPLQALREEPLASTLRWPGDDEATCGGRGATRGPASNSQRGQPSVRDNANVLSVSACTATDQGRHWMAQIADYCCPCYTPEEPSPCLCSHSLHHKLWITRRRQPSLPAYRVAYHACLSCLWETRSLHTFLPQHPLRHHFRGLSRHRQQQRHRLGPAM